MEMGLRPNAELSAAPLAGVKSGTGVSTTGSRQCASRRHGVVEWA
jgi:hypothetical protein